MRVLILGSDTPLGLALVSRQALLGRHDIVPMSRSACRWKSERQAKKGIVRAKSDIVVDVRIEAAGDGGVQIQELDLQRCHWVAKACQRTTAAYLYLSSSRVFSGQLDRPYVEDDLPDNEETVGQLLWTAGKRDGEEKKSGVSTVLSGVVKFLDYRMKKQNVKYKETIPPGLDIPVAPHDLEELFLNTMINSIQAMEDGGQLTVSAKKDGPAILLQIQDTGIGIPYDKINKVFDLFYSTKKAGEGTGLGMWMSYELVAKYKGKILLQSEEGTGTTVSITIPEIS